MKKYRNCTEYWLNTDSNEFRGEFESMYQDISDPWGCEQKFNSRNNNLFLDCIIRRLEEDECGRFLDIGCGAGGVTHLCYERINKSNHFIDQLKFIGVDISETAIKKASEKYPDILFLVHDIRKSSSLLSTEKFNCVLLSEVMWYLLDNLETTLLRIKRLLKVNGIFAVHQYFPEVQNYGKNICGGIGEFLIMMRRFGFVVCDHIECIENDGRVLLATFVASE